jgi:hypothetical protein
LKAKATEEFEELKEAASEKYVETKTKAKGFWARLFGK